MPNSMDLNVPALQERVTKILKDPKSEWSVIEAEPTTVEKLYKGYIAPLAAIPAIATFIGLTVVGVSMPFVGTYRESMPRGFANMIVSYILGLVLVYVAAMVISKLAPTFESKPDDLQALKLVAYAYTPAWLAGVFYILPVMAILAIVGGLYSIYLFYVGLPVMMKTPQAKVIPYMVVSALVVIVAGILVGVVSAAMTGVARI